MKIAIRDEWWEVEDFGYKSSLINEYIPSTYDYPEEFPDMLIKDLWVELDDVTPKLIIGNWYKISAKFKCDDFEYDYNYHIKLENKKGNTYFFRDFEI